MGFLRRGRPQTAVDIDKRRRFRTRCPRERPSMASRTR